MKTDYLKFLGAVTNSRLSGPDRSFAIAAAVAASVADFTAVPASKVDSPSSEYARSAALLVREAVGCFNEVVPFDIRLALDLARKFWMLRYETIHVRRTHDVTPGDYFCGYFSVDRNFSGDEIECLNRLASEIGLLEISIRDCLQKQKNAVENKNAAVAGSDTGETQAGYPVAPALA